MEHSFDAARLPSDDALDASSSATSSGVLDVVQRTRCAWQSVVERVAERMLPITPLYRIAERAKGRRNAHSGEAG